MPLPKSSSIAAKATEVYTEVWSVILQQIWSMPPTREDDLSELSRILPYLRQLLTCCACAGLLEDAMISLSCGHCYCSECQFRDPLLKIQCRQCRDRTGLVVESQLRVVVKCYRHMCGILADKVLDNPALLKLLSNSERRGKEAKIVPTTESAENEMSNKKSSRKSSSIAPNTESETNLIVEILREIQEGVKVSRSVLVIKPPQKYLAPKSVTPKKDQQHASAVSSSSRSKRALDLHSEHSFQESDTRRDRKSGESHSSTLISHRISALKGKRKRRSMVAPRHGSSSGEQAKKRQRVRNTVVPKLETSTEEDEEVDILSLSDSNLHLNELDMLQDKLLLDKFKPDIPLTCLDERFLNVSANGITLKQSTTLQADDITRDFDPKYLGYRKSESGIRERLWDPMCPRVRARRSRSIIDRTAVQQVKTARGVPKTKTKVTKPPVQPRLVPPLPFALPIAPPCLDDYEPPLPDDLSGLVLEKLEGEDPLPYIDRLLFRPPPMYPPPPFPHPLPPPPPFVPGQPPMFGPMHPDPRYPLIIPPMKPPFPTIPKTPPKPKSVSKSPSTTPKKRRTPGYSEDGWRCRCGTNNVMFPEKVCAKGKCPCYSKGIPCKNCLCKHCHNPNNK